MKKIIFAVIIITGSYLTGFAQKDIDKANFVEYKAGFYVNSIMKDISEYDEKQEVEEPYKRFVMDQSSYDLPNKVSLYKREWANDVISQGNTGTCWNFSTTSFLESEEYRIYKKKVKLSEMFTVYWEYVAKAREYVDTRGKSNFGEGSEGNAVARQWKIYGTMPEDVYDGKLPGQKFYNHEKMFAEMEAYLKNLKITNAWNADITEENIKAILNHYMGVPPTEFVVDGTKYTPKTYLKDYLKLNPDDYVEILSYKQEPYWQKVEYKVPDNWWHSKEYYNLPLDEFMKIIKNSIREGYTMSIGGDVSETGFSSETQCAMIPSYDIPSEYINEDARQFRFSNKTTTDDHGMHLVGYFEKDGKDWYLIKDSSSGSRNNDKTAPEFGYYFFSEDYVKLKMMGFTIHKDAVKDYLKKFK